MKHAINKELSSEELNRAIASWINGRNAQRDRVIMQLRLIDGLTFEQIAEKVDMSTRGVVKIVYKWLDVLSRHI